MRGPLRLMVSSLREEPGDVRAAVPANSERTHLQIRMCCLLACMGYSLFPVKNIIHDKFDNLDYLWLGNKDL